ncbi:MULTISPECIES: hypothetical protein [unclassified Streptomyces]|uniref:hypothetical protein n=1 Tax=unclassified Streptomyces TaxID=2593676 RepID=UPI002259E854|nr:MULTISPECIES: hypothetical protein [unclassified Streptomyces]MCX5333250.1 hypothetical protein [Streptomyces sp. NBC_00140]MCX5362668.1 hypothetical protein [Streptomyces sp. NBC_00124]
MTGLSVRGWATGVGAVLVLVGTGTWVMWPAGVDGRLWGEVRPVIEARLAADSRGSGYGETVPGIRARWFCRAEALELAEHDGQVRAGINTLCMEYGARGQALVECSGGRYPQVVRLEREGDGGYRVVSQEEPPDGAGNAEWTKAHFGFFAESETEAPMSAATLEAAARAHFHLPADAPVSDC